MSLLKNLSLLICCLSLISCAQKQSDDTDRNDLEIRVASLESELKELKEQTALNQFIQSFEKFAYMTPGNDGYSLIKSDFGVITVSLSNIQPYANGSKITLQFGNLSAATIDGLKAKLEWGSINKEGRPNNQEAKSREVSFNESLASGSWTNANVVLEGIPPQELGFVRLSEVGHRGIRLRR